MYFNVYADTGFAVDGYLIPDGFSTEPEIRVQSGNQDFGIFACDVFLAGPYEHKHHATGIVGFHLDEMKVPGLADLSELEISDAQSGFVFYRRLRPQQHLSKRVFRLETQFAPHSELDRSMRPFFQFYANSAEKYGMETVRQMLEIAHQPSTYVSGRVLLKGVQQYLTPDTILITSIRDPFYELAIRLWSIASYRRRHLSFVSERDRILFEPAMTYLEDTNFSDPQDVIQRLRKAPKEVLSLFESPFTHQLVATSPVDKISRDGVSSALDALSQFTVFCPHETNDQLVNDIAELLGIDRAQLAFNCVRSPFTDLADALRDLRLLEHVLENDLMLYFFVKKAADRADTRI